MIRKCCQWDHRTSTRRYINWVVAQRRIDYSLFQYVSAIGGDYNIWPFHRIWPGTQGKSIQKRFHPRYGSIESLHQVTIWNLFVTTAQVGTGTNMLIRCWIMRSYCSNIIFRHCIRLWSCILGLIFIRPLHFWRAQEIMKFDHINCTSYLPCIQLSNTN